MRYKYFSIIYIILINSGSSNMKNNKYKKKLHSKTNAKNVIDTYQRNVQRKEVLEVEALSTLGHSEFGRKTI